jgi:hypothetical protein
MDWICMMSSAFRSCMSSCATGLPTKHHITLTRLTQSGLIEGSLVGSVAFWNVTPCSQLNGNQHFDRQKQ